ncbi:MAG: carbohydrate ABC transporter permease [Eubacteriales bacterium]|nr:carbohydrate ABC transporter permease [Eubacteriales bacterium]
MRIKRQKKQEQVHIKSKGEWKYQLILIVSLIVMMYPIVYMIGTSFKTLSDIFSSGLNVFTANPTMDNYAQVIGANNVLRLLRNSFTIALIVTVSKIITSVLASYCLCFMNLKHPELIFGLFTVSMFIPFSVIMIPNYLTLSRMGLNNTLLGVALPQLADAMGIYRIRQSMRSIPKPLIEAARLDNVGHFTILRRIVLPLVKPAVIAMIIFFFINSWNEFVWPMLILKKEELYTITLALQTFLDAESGSAWGSSMALATIATMVPMVLYIFAQRKIIGTFMQSGVKE